MERAQDSELVLSDSRSGSDVVSKDESPNVTDNHKGNATRDASIPTAYIAIRLSVTTKAV